MFLSTHLHPLPKVYELGLESHGNHPLSFMMKVTWFNIVLYNCTYSCHVNFKFVKIDLATTTFIVLSWSFFYNLTYILVNKLLYDVFL
jgi:hypothetical protein